MEAVVGAQGTSYLSSSSPLILFLEAGSYPIALAGSEPPLLLQPPDKYWAYRCGSDAGLTRRPSCHLSDHCPQSHTSPENCKNC